LPDVPERPIPLGAAVLTWLLAWLLGMLVVAAGVLAAFGVDGDDYSIAQLALAISASWIVFIVALVLVSHRYGSGDAWGDFIGHFAVAWKPVDLLGVPVGVATQLALPAFYWPLRELWPSTFSSEEIEERAQELADKAGGASTLLLFLVVAAGAPLVEELMYRGLLQRATARVVGVWGGLVLASLFFALVHPSPVEYPGLFVAGLVFGIWLAVTGRIGGSIITHVAFNVTGLVLTLW
jgi:membrane protease YdiL (CAAX protease family)